MKIIEQDFPTGSDFFTSIWKAQTWLNVLYLLISFPLGLIYFIFLVTGISLGFGLLITVFGIFILMGVLALVHLLARFEVSLTNSLLGFQIRPDIPRYEKSGFWKRFGELLRSPFTWKGFAFLFIRFPLGIFSFSLTIGLLSASLGLIAYPFLFRFQWYNWDWPGYYFGFIETIPGAVIVGLVGITLLYASLFVLNLLAWVSGIFAKALLGND